MLECVSECVCVNPGTGFYKIYFITTHFNCVSMATLSGMLRKEIWRKRWMNTKRTRMKKYKNNKTIQWNENVWESKEVRHQERSSSYYTLQHQNYKNNKFTFTECTPLYARCYDIHCTTPEARPTYGTGCRAEVSRGRCVHTNPEGNTSLNTWWGMLLSTDRSSEIKGIEVWVKRGEDCWGRASRYFTPESVIRWIFTHGTYEQSGAQAKPASCHVQLHKISSVDSTGADKIKWAHAEGFRRHSQTNPFTATLGFCASANRSSWGNMSLWWTIRGTEASCLGCHSGKGSAEGGLSVISVWSVELWAWGYFSEKCNASAHGCLHEKEKLKVEKKCSPLRPIQFFGKVLSQLWSHLLVRRWLFFMFYTLRIVTSFISSIHLYKQMSTGSLFKGPSSCGCWEESTAGANNDPTMLSLFLQPLLQLSSVTRVWRL